MATKTLKTQYDPQYGWVVADASKSGKFLGFDKAAELYNSLYEPTYNSRGRQTNALNQAYLSFDGRNPYQTNTIGFGQQAQNQRDPGEELMRWYSAASNQDLMNDPIAREIILAQGRQFSRNPWQQQQTFLGQTQQDPYQTDLRNLRKTYGASDFQNAMDAINMAQYVNPRSTTNNIFDNTQSNLGGYSSAANRALTNAQRLEGAVDFQRLMQSNPLYYENPYLTRYTDSPNVSLVSRDGGPFTTYHRHSNISKTRGGEDLADEVFQYYMNLAKPGELGQDWTNVDGNQYVRQGTFGGQQVYFTPYDYAIHGIPVGTGREAVTNISSLSPEYWEQQGNLQKIGDQWGFITATNPYAGPVTYEDLVKAPGSKTFSPTTVTTSGENQVVSPETVKYVQKTSGGGGLFGGGGLGSLLTTAAQIGLGGWNPLNWGLGVSALGWPGTISTLANFTEGSNPKAPKTWQREVVAPQYNPLGYNEGGLAQYKRENHG